MLETETVRRLEFQCQGDWEVGRASRIGSSDAAGILGCGYSHQVKTSIWLEKSMGIKQKFSASSRASLEAGRDNESNVLAKFQEVNPWLKVTPESRCFYVNSGYPTLCASLDAYAVADDGRKFVVEAKWVSEHKAKEWATEDVAPLKYMVQVQHQLLVTGLSQGYLVAVVDGKYHQRLVDRHDRLIEQMMAKYADFWGYVERNVPPPDSSPLSYALLRSTRKAGTARQVGKMVSDAYRGLLCLFEKRSELESEVPHIAKREDVAVLGSRFAALEKEIATWKHLLGRESMGVEYLILDDQSVVKLGVNSFVRSARLPRGVEVVE